MNHGILHFKLRVPPPGLLPPSPCKHKSHEQVINERGHDDVEDDEQVNAIAVGARGGALTVACRPWGVTTRVILVSIPCTNNTRCVSPGMPMYHNSSDEQYMQSLVGHQGVRRCGSCKHPALLGAACTAHPFCLTFVDLRPHVVDLLHFIIESVLDTLPSFSIAAPQQEYTG